MVTEWRGIPGYEFHQVSDDGVVRSRDRNFINSRGQKRFISGKTKKQRLGRGNYLLVAICEGGRNDRHAVHRLVLCSFIGPPKDGQESRHLNGNRQDNRLINLKWGTKTENAQDKHDHGTTVRGEDVTNSKLSESQVIQIRGEYQNGEKAITLAQKYGVCKSAIHYVLSGHTWKHLPGGGEGRSLPKTCPVCRAEFIPTGSAYHRQKLCGKRECQNWWRRENRK